MLAYEMAHQLMDQGSEVRLVALFDTYAPGYLKKASFARRAAAHTENIKKADLSYMRQLAAVGKTVALRRFWSVAHSVAQKTGVPVHKPFGNVEGMVFLRLLATYRPKPIAQRLTLFRATEQPTSATGATDNGWGQLALGGVDVFDVPGTHLSIIMEPNVRVLATGLREALDRTGV